MTRIRYRLQPDGWRTSLPMLTQHGMTLVRHKDDQYEFVQVDTGIVVAGGKGLVGARKLKEIKKVLKEHGAVFNDEVRPRMK